MPSVRGREQLLVSLFLGSSSASTGAIAGFFGGVAWSALLGPALNVPALAALIIGALALDVIGVAPLSMLRQVPQLWGRIFRPSAVSVLYGARLGVGPLTILRTWLWWAAFVAGSSAGPWWSLVVGGAFGVARVAAMLVVATRAGSLRARERGVSVGLAFAVVVALFLLGSFVDTDGRRDVAAASSMVTGRRLHAFDARDGESTTTPGPSAASTTASGAAPPSPEEDIGLAGALPDTLLPGWGRIADEAARRLGPLDLAAAAAAEGDAPAERALLETRHFVRGHARGWRDDGDRVAYASVYEFASPADAEAYLIDGVTTIESRGARVYDVAAPAGGRGFSQAEQTSSGEGATVSHGVVFVRGPRFALVFVSGPDSGIDNADAITVARAVESTLGSVVGS